MSKQHHNTNTIWNRLRRGLAGILSLALILGLLPSGTFTAHAADADSWAMPYAQQLVNWGVMRGDIYGNLDLDRSITRAEFVTMMNRAYGYTKLNGHPFADVYPNAPWQWYVDDIDIAYNIGYFQGTSPTTASADDLLTREQAAVLLSRNMMLQPTTGETLGFSDTRSLSHWSRGLVGAAAAQGVINGYEDGTFRPQDNITRGEVAAMLARAIGTPIQSAGDHTLGNVYGNVTVNTAGVSLRDGIIAGNLYLTGGIDLGDVLLENITVLGEIIVSGAGESHSSQSSITLRNVSADAMTVDSISSQFVTIRAEGNTDIPTTTVRTNAYVDDSTLAGYGLWKIIQDGGSLLQVAGSIKEILNQTPNSSLQVVQGSAEKITIDEAATGSTVLVDGDARVEDLNLDVATKVEGEGDIKDLNVGAAGSSVATLPDNITIRPGITTDVAGSNMNSTQAAESSADPRLLAGYPAVRNIAPNSAELVFSANKAGTIYWAVSAVGDGSVSADDLINPPSYGGRILKSGSITVASSRTEYTASISGLTQDGSYYVSAILVDGRQDRSPLKVTAFNTPDGTTPAFNTGYPVMTMNTTQTAQVTVMTNKSCQLYYALLPAGSTAPTPAEFKANAVRGNLGYGVVDAVKNVTQPINVNNTPLQELTRYTLYLWLTDYDGAKSSRVYSLNFTTPDEQAPVIVSAERTNANETGVEVTFSLNEAATLYWAIVPEGKDNEMNFEGVDEDHYHPGDGDIDETEIDIRKLQIKIESGGGNSIKNGRKVSNTAYASAQVTMNETRPLNSAQTGTNSYTMYLVAKDAAGNYSKVRKINVRTKDATPPTVTQEFTSYNDDNKEQPLVDTDIRLVFSESVRPGLSGTPYLELYNAVESARREGNYIQEAAARTALAEALYAHIKLYLGQVEDNRNPVPRCTSCTYDTTTGTFVYTYTDGSGRPLADPNEWVINYCNATVAMESGKMVVTFPTEPDDPAKNALHLGSGATYHFVVSGIRDNAEEANLLNPDPTNLPSFTTMFAKVILRNGDEQTLGSVTGITLDTSDAQVAKNDPRRIDFHFQMNPMSVDRVADNMFWDMLLWTDATVVLSVYSRPIDGDGNPLGPDDTVDRSAAWTYEGQVTVPVDQQDGMTYRSAAKWLPSLNQTPAYNNDRLLKGMTAREYAVHIDRLEASDDYTAWNQTVTLRVSVVAGTRDQLTRLISNGSLEGDYSAALEGGVASIGTPDPYTIRKPFTDSRAPSILTPPDVSVGDTSAEIKMMLDRPGQVYYLIFPLSNLFLTGNTPLDNTATELTEDRVSGVVSYTPSIGVTTVGDIASPPLAQVPLMNGDPDRAGITNGSDPRLGELFLKLPDQTSFTNNQVFQGVIKGRTSSVAAYTTASITLTERLSPNTVYMVCLLTRGVSAVYGANAYCYRFTTDPATRPLLNLKTDGTTVIADSDRAATLDGFLAVNGLEGARFNEKFAPDYTSSLWTATSTGYTFTPPTGKTKATMTVLDAMATPCYTGERYVGSVFDIFASDTAKNTFSALIRSQSADGNAIFWAPHNASIANTNNGAITAPNSNRFNCTQYMTVGQMYSFVAVARSGNSADSFRAYYPVQLQDKTPPMLDNAYFRNITMNGSTVTSAELVLEFSEALYFIRRGDSSQNRYPIDNCAFGVHTDTTGLLPATPPTDGTPQYYSVAGTVTAGGGTTSVLSVSGSSAHTTGVVGAPIRNIIVKVTNLSIREETISFNAGTIVDWAGNGTNRAALSVKVRVERTGGTDDNPVYDPVITSVTPAWDNR